MYFVFFILFSSPVAWFILLLSLVAALIPDVIIKIYDHITQVQLLKLYSEKENKTQKKNKISNKVSLLECFLFMFQLDRSFEKIKRLEMEGNLKKILRFKVFVSALPYNLLV